MKDALGAVQRLAVLGGTSEIGSAIARHLVTERPGTLDVVLAGRNRTRLDATGAELVAAGARTASSVVFDAVATDTHPAVVDELWAGGADVDVAVLAFGALGDQDRLDDDPAAAVELMTLNYVAQVSMALSLARRMKAQGHGTIVVLSSVAGERVRKANYVYGSTKAGLDGFAMGLGDRLAGTGVRVLVVRSGFVVGRMTAGMDPAPLATTPDEVAADVARALARGRELVWSPAALRWLFVVLRHLPRPLFRRLPR